MSGKQTYIIVCDGCGEWFQPPTIMSRLLDIRGEAVCAGWVHRIVIAREDAAFLAHFDFCRECAAQGEPDRHEKKLKQEHDNA